MSIRRIAGGIALDCDVTGCTTTLQAGPREAAFETGINAVNTGLDLGWRYLDYDTSQHACPHGDAAHRAAVDDEEPSTLT